MLTVVSFEPVHRDMLYAAQGICGPVVTMQAVTILEGAVPLCCFGITSPWPGLGFAWFEERDQGSMQKYRFRVARVVLRHWQQWLGEGAYQRIECHVPRQHIAAMLLARWLGFEWVAEKPHYGRDGETIMEGVYYPRGG